MSEQCSRRLYLVHHSREEPDWSPNVLEEIKSLDYYSQELFDNNFNDLPHGIIGAVVLDGEKSNWYGNNVNYFKNIGFAYGPFVHIIGHSISFVEAVPYRGNVGNIIIDPDTMKKIDNKQEYKMFVCRMRALYGNDLFIGGDKGVAAFSVRKPMGDLECLGLKITENKMTPLCKLKNHPKKPSTANATNEWNYSQNKNEEQNKQEQNISNISNTRHNGYNKYNKWNKYNDTEFDKYNDNENDKYNDAEYYQTHMHDNRRKYKQYEYDQHEYDQHENKNNATEKRLDRMESMLQQIIANKNEPTSDNTSSEKTRKRTKNKQCSDADTDAQTFKEIIEGSNGKLTKSIIVGNPSKWPSAILIDSLYAIKSGKKEENSNWYKLCETRSQGVNKYHKSIAKWLAYKKIKFSKRDYERNISISKFCSKKNTNFTDLTQKGAKNVGCGSTKDFKVDKKVAYKLLKDDLVEYLNKQYGVESDQSYDSNDDDNDSQQSSP
eukprot:69296_1